MADLSFSSFLEFVAAVDHANQISADLPEIEKRYSALQKEETEAKARLAQSYADIDKAKVAAKALTDAGEATRLANEATGQKKADALMAAANKQRDELLDGLNRQLASLRADIKSEEQRLSAAKAASKDAEETLAQVKRQIDSLKKVFA